MARLDKDLRDKQQQQLNHEEIQRDMRDAMIYRQAWAQQRDMQKRVSHSRQITSCGGILCRA